MQQLFIAFLPLFFLLLLIGAVLKAIQRGWLKGAEVAYNETVQEDVVEQESSYSDDASDNGGEGSSTAIRQPRKLGKKRAEKLQRKEEQRAYRAYLEQQREDKRFNEEIEEEEERQRRKKERRQAARELERIRKVEAEKRREQEEELIRQQAVLEHQRRVYRPEIRQQLMTQLENYIMSKRYVHVDELASQLDCRPYQIVEMIEVLISNGGRVFGVFGGEENTYFVSIDPNSDAALAIIQRLQSNGQTQLQDLMSDFLSAIEQSKK